MDERLPDAVEIGVYRIIQEAITNIARHAAASHVTIRLARTSTGLDGSVSDDGQGFVVDREARERASGRGLGLLGMRERAALLGGSVTIESDVGAGTTLQFTIPLANGGAA
jgi:signal transduction histidine kinase